MLDLNLKTYATEAAARWNVVSSCFSNSRTTWACTVCYAPCSMRGPYCSTF